MKKPKYILNIRTDVVHVYPAYESCNLDAIPKKYRKPVDNSLNFIRCKRCFKKRAKCL